MKKKIARYVVLFTSILLVSLMATYIGLAVYYHNAFEYGTWINQVYCTGRSIEEVNEELVKDFHYDGITIVDRDGNSYEIVATDIAYQFDFVKALEIYQKRQNSWAWIDSLFHAQVRELTPVVSFDEQKLEECLGGIPILQQTQAEEDRRVAIIKTNQGYELINERVNVLSTEEAREAIITAISDSKTELSLEEAGCYHDLKLDAAMQDTLALWKKLDAFQHQCNVVYQMGEDQIPVDASVVCEWIELSEDGSFALDESGNLQLAENAIPDFIKNLAAEYDTVGGTRQFQPTRGEAVMVEGGIYGNQIDQSAEVEYLTDAFNRKLTEVHEPTYKQKAWKQGKDDIGATYIEVDMGEQMMYYYKDGVLQLETPIVTGNTSLRRGTPSGVNYVYLKQTNRILRGPGYASHVDFWMPVKGGIGIHDAAWRSKYGGEIYKTNGSHGCINTPRDAMEQLFDMAEVGTPVVMFY